jgi:hypothetical protein
MTTRQAQRTAALNPSETQPTTVTYNESAAVEAPQNVGGGTPAAALALDDTASVQDSLPGLQTVSNSSTSNAASSVDVEGVNLQNIAEAARAMLVHTIKRATTSRAGGSPPVDVEVEAADAPPSVRPDVIPMLLNDPGADEAPISAVRIRGPYPASETADEGTPPDSVVGTEPGTTPTPLSACGPSEYNSITTALLAGHSHPRIFVSLARQLEIYDEDIETSLV